jgi:hypothetical protein
MPSEIAFKGKSIIEHPIELEQRPLYEFDADERMPPAWTHAQVFQPDDHSMPHCSFHNLSHFSTNQAVNRFWGLKYIPRLFSEYILTFRVEEPMKICVTN